MLSLRSPNLVDYFLQCAKPIKMSQNSAASERGERCAEGLTNDGRGWAAVRRYLNSHVLRYNISEGSSRRSPLM